MIILACAGSLPGYWTAILTIDTLGRKPLQLLGFVILTLLFCVLGFYYHHLSEGSLLALYVIAQFFFNWGPNTTTFIVPGECFPTRYRSTGHGLSAAFGKIGAIIAQVISIPLLNKDSPPNCSGNKCSPWLDRLMQIFALFMLCGMFVSFLIPETKGITLEELAGEPPTSYNSGRNGSISVVQKRSWNPFGGGQPAGFSYTRPGASRGTAWARSPRLGIMTSPELAAQNGAAKKMNRRSKQRGRNSSGGSDEYAFSSTSSTRGITMNGGDDENPRMPASVLPGWSAGWGRIDRGAAPGMENIRLQDVGSLLK